MKKHKQNRILNHLTQANGGGIPKLHMASCQPGAFSCRILPNFSFCQLDGRLRLLQTDIKTPPWAFCISPVSSSMKWEMYTSQIWWRQRIQRMKMFRAFFCWNIDDTRKGSGVWANSVTTDGKHLVNHLIIIQQVQDHMSLNRSFKDLSLSNTKKNIVIFTITWKCQIDSNSLDSIVMIKSSTICFTSLSSKWRQSLLPLMVMTSYASWPPNLSIFLNFSLWTAS
jgi:hypothetical protein